MRLTRMTKAQLIARVEELEARWFGPTIWSQIERDDPRSSEDVRRAQQAIIDRSTRMNRWTPR